MPTKPTKLNTAASASATPGFMQRVDTAMAMALGASVAPETIVTPMTSVMMAPKDGYVVIWPMKAARERSIALPENNSRCCSAPSTNDSHFSRSHRKNAVGFTFVFRCLRTFKPTISKRYIPRVAWIFTHHVIMAFSCSRLDFLAHMRTSAPRFGHPRRVLDDYSVILHG